MSVVNFILLIKKLHVMKYQILFIISSVEGHLGYELLAIKRNAALNICIQVFVRVFVNFGGVNP